MATEGRTDGRTAGRGSRLALHHRRLRLASCLVKQCRRARLANYLTVPQFTPSAGTVVAPRRPLSRPAAGPGHIVATPDPTPILSIRSRKGFLALRPHCVTQLPPTYLIRLRQCLAFLPSAPPIHISAVPLIARLIFAFFSNPGRCLCSRSGFFRFLPPQGVRWTLPTFTNTSWYRTT